jgi:hypothetical protein
MYHGDWGLKFLVRAPLVDRRVVGTFNVNILRLQRRTQEKHF